MYSDTTAGSFEREALALAQLHGGHANGPGHKHLLQCLGSIHRGDERYFMFPWADGGNLREFWSGNERCLLTPDLVLQVLKQILGLADALAEFHKQNWRHGDIKPENILRFKDNTTLGQLKLGDMGLARHHNAVTLLREEETKTRSGTMRYEPPDDIISPDVPRSRRYDIWSLGCVMLEFVVWMVHGPDGLSKFNRSLQNSDGTPGAYYSIIEEAAASGLEPAGRRPPSVRAELHKGVKEWLRQLCQDTGEKTVLGDLTRLIQSDLLVIHLPCRFYKTSMKRTLRRPGTLDEPPDLQLLVPPKSDTSNPDEGMSSESRSRADVQTVVGELRRIHPICLADNSYLLPESLSKLQVGAHQISPAQCSHYIP